MIIRLPFRIVVAIAREPEHEHIWSEWSIAREELRGPFGITEADTNERQCQTCHLRERRPMETRR